MAADVSTAERWPTATEELQASYWGDDWASINVISVGERNRAKTDLMLLIWDIINKEIDDYSTKIRDLNAKLPKEQQFFPVCVRPRDPQLLIMARAPFFKEYQMGNTSPTSWGCKRFSNPGPGAKYTPSTMLQVFCLSFAKRKAEPMEVYGFVAVRDDRQPLRNYIFKVPREQAYTLSSDFPMLPLISPIRGMSVWNNALVEISLRAKEKDSSDDLVLVDSCIEFRWDMIKRGKKLKSIIDGPFGVFEMGYMFIKHGIEAVVEVDIPEKLVGDHVLIVARSTGFKDELTIFDGVVKEENRKISYVIVASMGGSLYFGFLATGNHASADYIGFKVKKSGSHGGHVLIFKESDRFLQRKGKNLRKSPQLPLKKGKKRISFQDPEAIEVPFRVTFSTMGYYNNGMITRLWY